VEAARLRAGQVFGELALEAPEERRRSATVKSLTKCEFAVLSKDDYYRVLKKVESRITNSKADFLAAVPAFSHQSFSQLRKLLQVFKEETYQRHQYVYNQGDAPKHMYIVVDGDFEILR